MSIIVSVAILYVNVTLEIWFNYVIISVFVAIIVVLAPVEDRNKSLD